MEPSVAVAHLVRLCADPESAALCTASSYRLKGQTGLRNVSEEKILFFLKLGINEGMKELKVVYFSLKSA